MSEFAYQEMFPLGKDTTEYRMLTKDHVSLKSFEGKDILKIDPEGLTLLSEQAFRDVSHLLRSSHLELLAKIFDDPESSDNDRYVALEMLKNAVISAGGVFPLCQDTGTAIVMGKKGHQVWTDFSDEEFLAKGVYNAYTTNNLRYSQNAPLTMYEEKTRAVIFPHRLNFTRPRETHTNFSLWQKGADPRINHISIRKPKPCSRLKLSLHLRERK